MEFMQWALDIATRHPALNGALVSSHGQWLDVLLADGRAFRFRPSAMIRPDADESVREALLVRLIDIGISQAKEPEIAEEDLDRAPHEPDTSPASGTSLGFGASREHLAHPSTFHDNDTPASADEPDKITASTPIVPIVRAADYFINPSTQADPLVHVPLTEFLAVGLAYDLPNSVHPVYYSGLEDDHRPIGEILAESVVSLRNLSGAHNQAVEIAVTDVVGAQVLAFMTPLNYEVSWFSDLDMMQEVAERLSTERPGDVPLFVPASRTKLYIVFADDPNLAAFFQLLFDQRESPDCLYPLPHTVAADGWREWVPLPGSQVADVLADLRGYFRSRIYAGQVRAMRAWGELGELVDFHVRTLRGGHTVSEAVWDANSGPGSLPHTDYITFVRERGPMPWDETPAVRVSIPTHVVRDLWPEGLHSVDNLWPARWEKTSFPPDDVLKAMADAAGKSAF
ncbi:hypothetical protein [Arcanobacterium canis]